MDPTLSIIVPVYNENTYNLNTLVQRLGSALETLSTTYEIVFVNDGSREDVLLCLKEICQKNQTVKLVNLSRNFGQQAAITAGIDFAFGKAIIIMDSDLQDPPELIPEMVTLWQQGFDVIHAKRHSRKDQPLKKFGAYLFYRLMSLLSTTKIPEDTGEFKLLDRRVVTALQLLPERRRYLRGLIPWLGFKQTTILVKREARQYGKTTYTLTKLLSLGMDGLLSFTYAPLYLSSVIGLIIIVCSFLSPAFCFFFFHKPFSPFIFFAALILFISGLQFLVLGILGLYLARIFDEVKARPVYIVSDIHEANKHGAESDG